jgi:membrane associated rhomboid family serine protease
MARGADLFVVCKNCGSEVSPYVTECPYCGQRVRKRAPKLERSGAAAGAPGRAGRARRTRTAAPRGPRLGRLRPGEIPGLRAGGLTRPWATILLVSASFAVYLLAAANVFSPAELAIIDNQWYRRFTAPFAHFSGGGSIFAGGAYQLATMTAVGIYGWLLERRHGAWVVILLYLVSGAGAMAIAAELEPSKIIFGANGLGLGMVAAWAVPDLLAWRRDEDWEGDLLGTGVIAAVLLLMPLAVSGCSAVAGVAGGTLGLLVGLVLTRFSRA